MRTRRAWAVAVVTAASPVARQPRAGRLPPRARAALDGREAHLVAQRHRRSRQGVLAEGRRRVPRGPPERHDQGRADPERAVHDQDPGGPAVERPARHLPAVGRRPDGRPGQGRQGHGHHRARSPPGSRPSAARPPAGRSTASSTACRTASASWASGTTRTLFKKAGITRRRRPGRAERRHRQAEGGGHHADRGRRQGQWPDAFYWDYLALRECSQARCRRRRSTYNFTDPCFIKAGQDLQTLLGAKPFQRGFLGTPAQQGAG